MRFPAVTARLIFLVAVISGVWQTLHYGVTGFGAGWETVAIARNLALGNGFSSPYASLPTGPTAHLAPLFPAMLAGLIRVFGDTPLFALAAVILYALGYGLYCALFVPLSNLLFDDRAPGLVVGAFSAVIPTIRPMAQWDTIYAAAGSQLFCLASARLFRANRGAAAGLICGVLLLLNPAMLLVAIAWLAYLRPPRRAVAAFAAATALVCVPWSVRNYSRLGGVFFIRDNLGSEMRLSNADCAGARDAENGCHALLQPNANVHEASLIRDMGEYRYNRMRMAEALRWIGEHPARFRELTLQRIREFWFPTPERPPIYEYSRWLISALAAAGLFLLAREGSRTAVFFAGALALYPLVYYVVQAMTRYASPVLWVAALPAAYAATRAARAAR